MMRTVMAMLASTLALPAWAQSAPPAWLVGHWCADAANGATVCETWQPVGADGSMHGTSETRRGEVRRTENMAIFLRDGRLVFHAEPPGQAPTDFYASGEPAPLALVFDNPAHDYPQRVRYWRDGALLKAEISLADGSKPIGWTYRLVP